MRQSISKYSERRAPVHCSPRHSAPPAGAFSVPSAWNPVCLFHLYHCTWYVEEDVALILLSLLSLGPWSCSHVVVVVQVACRRFHNLSLWHAARFVLWWDFIRKSKSKMVTPSLFCTCLLILLCSKSSCIHTPHRSHNTDHSSKVISTPYTHCGATGPQTLVESFDSRTAHQLQRWNFC